MSDSKAITGLIISILFLNLIIFSTPFGTILASESTSISTHPRSEINGTIKGMICGITHTEQIIVSAFEAGTTNLINSTYTYGTGASRSYSITLEGASDDSKKYDIKALEADNYWYDDAFNLSIVVHSEETTNGVNLSLTTKPTGSISGSVALIGMAGGPEALQDWADVTVTVEGTPITIKPNAIGEFNNVEVVSGTLNVSAAKPNFKEDYIESVIVQTNIDTLVDLQLIEDWDVKVTPKANSEVPKDTSIVAAFTNRINISTTDCSNFNIKKKSTNSIIEGLNESQYNWSIDNKTCTITPYIELEAGISYYVYINTEIKTETGEDAIHRIWETEFFIEIEDFDVSGFVTDSTNGIPIEGVNVSIGAIFVHTDTIGKYYLPQIMIGTHDISFKMAYYQDGTLQITVVDSALINQNISLNRVPPPIISIKPADGTKNVSLDSTIEVVFSNAMNDSTIDITTFVVSGGVTGIITNSTDHKTFTFTPDSLLTENTTYTWTLKKAIRAEGATENWYPWDVLFTFTTAQIPTKSIQILDYSPAGIGIPVNTDITIHFDTPIDTTTINNAVTITSLFGYHPSGTWSWDEDKIYFTFTLDAGEAFDFEERYKVTIRKGILMDATEMYSLEEDFEWSFMTEDYIPEDLSLPLVLGPFVDDEKEPIEGAKVTITISGTIYSNTTDELGIAIIMIPNSKWPTTGVYNVIITKENDDDINYDVTFSDGIPEQDSIPPYSTTEEDLEEDKRDSDYDISSIYFLISGIVILIIIIVVIVLLLLFRADKYSQTQKGSTKFDGRVRYSKSSDTPQSSDYQTPPPPPDSMPCPGCGTYIELDNNFCPACGTRIKSN